MSKRIDWVDICRGLGILLVICGHTLNNFLVRSVVFSFHMPLFFLLSGYSTKQLPDKADLLPRMGKNFKRLILPAYLIWVLRFPFYVLRDHLSYKPIQVLLSLLYASGVSIEKNTVSIPTFGMMWFLVALFWIRTISDILFCYVKDRKWIEPCMLIIHFAGMLIGRFCYLPFSLDVAMVAVLYYGEGIVLRNSDISLQRNKRLPIAVIVWAGVFGFLAFNKLHFEMATREYPFLGLSSIMSVAGSYAFVLLVSWLFEGRKSKLTDGLCLIGRDSLVLFSIHAFDTIWYPTILNICGSTVVSLVVRLIQDVVLFFAYIITRGRLRARVMT